MLTCQLPVSRIFGIYIYQSSEIKVTREEETKVYCDGGKP